MARMMLQRLRSWEAGTWPVLSLYLGLGVDRTEGRTIGARVTELLKRADEGNPPMSHSQAMSLRSDIERVRSLEGSIETEIGKGVAIFASHGAGWFEYVVVPDQSFRDIAVVDDRPYLRPLRTAERARRTVVVVPGREEVAIFEFDGGELIVREDVEGEEVRKKNFGGWYGLEEWSAEHHALEAGRRVHREAAAVLARRSRRGRMDLLFIGEHASSASELMKVLPPDVQERVAGRFPIDPHTMTPARVRERCAQLERAYDLRRAAEVIASTKGVADAHAGAVVGLQDTLDAANRHAISEVIVGGSEPVRGWACPQCALLTLSDLACEVCGTLTKVVPDVIDRLVESVIAHGGSAVEISDDRRESNWIGARVRFSVSHRKEET